MNIEKYQWLTGVIAAHPNRRVHGRTRLQKTMLLLQELGLPTDYHFSIYFYGPYSEGLAADVQMLTDYGLLTEDVHQSGDGHFDSTYIVEKDPGLEEIDEFASQIQRISQAESVPLELAATYVVYHQIGAGEAAALALLRRKKGAKCTPGNMAEAMSLLKDLVLEYADVDGA